MRSRRAFLRGSAAIASGAAAIRLASVNVSASHPDAKPDHVSISFDEALLDQYRPRLVLSEEDRDRLLGLYGWLATSKEYETDALVYWASYTHQTGVTSYDSHYGDHEPVTVFRDSKSGEVEGVAASVYHWLRGWTSDPLLDDKHPKLRVISPWHHYTATSEMGELIDVEDLQDVYQGWLDNGMEAELVPGANYDPWIMQGPSGRPHWWRNDFGSFSYEAFILGLDRWLGLREEGSL